MCADDAQTEAVLERTAAALRQALAAALEPPLPKLGRDLLGLDPQAMLRAPFSHERLTLRDNGCVVGAVARDYPGHRHSP